MSTLIALGEILNNAEVFTDGDWVESKDQDPKGDVRLTQLADVGDGFWIDKSSRYMTSEKAKKLRCTFLEPGDILIARMPDPIGRCCIFPGDKNPCVTVVDVCVVRPNTEKVNNRYLMHMINAPLGRQCIGRHVTGTTRQRISRKNLSKIQIPLPPLEEQKRIAAILDAADSLRARRRESIALLDKLVQSTFLEMLGDPVSNPKGWPIKKLSDFYLSKSVGTKCGPFGSTLKKSELVESGIPVWNMDNIDLSGKMVPPFRMWITEEKYETLKPYSVINNDIIISRAGTVGKMCIANTDYKKSIINTNLIRLRLGKDLLPEYFVSLMTYCKGRVGRLKKGPDGAFTHMNTGILDKLMFPYPPLHLQEKFSSNADSIEAQKALYRSQLEELDTLFASLQARAFNGEL